MPDQAFADSLTIKRRAKEVSLFVLCLDILPSNKKIAQKLSCRHGPQTRLFLPASYGAYL